ncbi:MAG: WecB/TagA/CpsF family glycosyltransferase [Acidobacteriia bacterium]|nr:WecB/TagA/CpsF family glycosyltransferase [Terriglobia bacterium]
MQVPSFNLLGIHFNAMTAQDLINVTTRAIDGRARCIIGNHNLHGLYFWYKEPKMREYNSLADYTNAEGMSLVLLGRLFGLPIERKHRCAYIDLLPILADTACRNSWRMFYLGSGPGVAEKAAVRLRTKHPGLQIRTHHGRFNAERSGVENQKVLAEINDYDPDILMVGMGMPRQETWVVENNANISALAIYCCGALMDYVAGEIPTPPRWMGAIGIEWLYRLFSEPARLWQRYLIEPWFVLGQLGRQYLAMQTPKVLGGGHQK